MLRPDFQTQVKLRSTSLPRGSHSFAVERPSKDKKSFEHKISNPCVRRTRRMPNEKFCQR
jgi:hypothetical protein